MACICQYFALKQQRRNSENTEHSLANKDEINIEPSAEKTVSITSTEVSASELAASKAEIWILKKNLTNANISIENLEDLVKSVVLKQNELLTDMYQLRHQNTEIHEECRLQRDYHTLERNSMMTELYEIRSLLYSRTKLLEETVKKNLELTNALQYANEKIYNMGIRYLQQKSSRSKCAVSSRSPTSSHKSTEE